MEEILLAMVRLLFNFHQNHPWGLVFPNLGLNMLPKFDQMTQVTFLLT
jgi:hypothetical protein